MKNKMFRDHLIADDFDGPFEKTKLTRRKKDWEDGFQNKDQNCRVIYDKQNFKCVQCGNFVNAGREHSGVNNRNHCPYCLWSRHMDLHSPGDRKADCKSRMEPIGLTIKQTCKRYGQHNPGELMLIHLCTGCGKYSINRIAADDDTPTVFRLYQDSCVAGEELQKHLITGGIFLLGSRDYAIVHTQLFGCKTSMAISIISSN
ncbi:MAG TPA: RNHCP domain-containing protein [Leptolinea sp.]